MYKHEYMKTYAHTHAHIYIHAYIHKGIYTCTHVGQQGARAVAGHRGPDLEKLQAGRGRQGGHPRSESGNGREIRGERTRVAARIVAGVACV